MKIDDGVRLIKQGRWYHVQFYDPSRRPKRKTVGLRKSHEATAVHLAKELAREYALGQFDPWTDKHESLTVLEALRRYTKAQAKKVSPATIKTYEDRVGGLAKQVGIAVKLEHVTSQDIEQYVYRDGLAQASRYTRFQTIAAFFNWCVSEGYIKASPADDAQRPEKPRSKVEFITPGQLETLCRLMEMGGDYWLRDMTRVAVHSGLRVSELCRLKWEDIQGGWVYVRKAKRGSTGRVPVTDQLADALVEIAPDGDLVFGKRKPGYVSKRFKSYCRKARLPETVCFHTLRHTYASWLSMGGEEIDKISDLMRHKAVSTTMKYRHLKPEMLKESANQAMNRLLQDYCKSPETGRDISAYSDKMHNAVVKNGS